MIFLGITLDVPNSMMVLPEEKLEKCRSLIEDALARKSITLRELQSLLGHLNFACRVTVPGRAFLRRAYALTHGAKKPFHHIKITSGTRSDLVMWQDFLSEYNRKSFFLLDKVYTDQRCNFIQILLSQSDTALCLTALGSMANGRKSGRGMT